VGVRVGCQHRGGDLGELPSGGAALGSTLAALLRVGVAEATENRPSIGAHPRLEWLLRVPPVCSFVEGSLSGNHPPGFALMDAWSLHKRVFRAVASGLHAPLAHRSSWLPVSCQPRSLQP
jgi:hypothetical protein